MVMSGLLELFRAPDPVLISRVEAVLADHDIESVIFDDNISAMEPGMFLFGRRVMVPAFDFDRARVALSMEAPELRESLKTRD